MFSIVSERTDAPYNLALEEALFDSVSSGNTDIFLVWQNAPSIIVGRHQNTAEEINREFCHDHGITVVRRETGGGAVYHDLGNVNFSFMSWLPGKKISDGAAYTERILNVLKELGVSAEFSSRNDITVCGRKICGTAQRRYGQRMLHHGCILVDTDTEMLSNALAADPEKFKSKGISSHRARIGNLAEFLPVQANRSQTVSLVIEALLKHCCSERRKPEQSILDRAEELAGSKYRSWDWNWGKSPDYTERRRHRFSWGKIELFLNVSHGLIQDCKFYGDFFASANVEELEALLAGKKSGPEALLAALHGVSLEAWFPDADRRELLNFICGVQPE